MKCFQQFSNFDDSPCAIVTEIPYNNFGVAHNARSCTEREKEKERDTHRRSSCAYIHVTYLRIALSYARNTAPRISPRFSSRFFCPGFKKLKFFSPPGGFRIVSKSRGRGGVEDSRAEVSSLGFEGVEGAGGEGTR